MADKNYWKTGLDVNISFGTTIGDISISASYENYNAYAQLGVGGSKSKGYIQGVVAGRITDGDINIKNTSISYKASAGASGRIWSDGSYSFGLVPVLSLDSPDFTALGYASTLKFTEKGFSFMSGSLTDMYAFKSYIQNDVYYKYTKKGDNSEQGIQNLRSSLKLSNEENAYVLGALNIVKALVDVIVDRALQPLLSQLHSVINSIDSAMLQLINDLKDQIDNDEDNDDDGDDGDNNDDDNDDDNGDDDSDDDNDDDNGDDDSDDDDNDDNNDDDNDDDDNDDNNDDDNDDNSNNNDRPGKGGELDPPGAPRANRSDPFVFDLDGDGKISTIHMNDSTVYLDHNNDEINNKSGWIAANDGLLFLDKDEDGQFSHLNELFGTHGKDGFAELSEYDDNNDGKINSSDEIWNKLQVWQDLNSDGKIQDGELKTLNDWGITQINLENKNANIENNGNYIIKTGSYIRSGVEYLAANLDLLYSKFYTEGMKDNGDTAMDFDFPYLKGYGKVKNSSSLYKENKLFADFTEVYKSDLSYYNFDQYLKLWSGLQAYHDTNDIDRSELSVYDKIWICERFMGIDDGLSKEFSKNQNSWRLDTTDNRELFEYIKNYYYSRFILSIKEVDGLLYIPEENKIYMNHRLIKTKIMELLNANNYLELEIYRNISKEIDVLIPTGIHGNSSDDSLSTGNHNNVITGGKGNDVIYTGTGDDVFIFNRGDGQDTIHDKGGNDTILFGAGITKDDILVQRDEHVIYIGLKGNGVTNAKSANDRIQINNFYNHHHYKVSNGCIENIKFADGLTLGLKELMDLQGSDINDSIYWTHTQMDINLGAGDDSITTGNHNNVITGGKGNDMIYTGTGDDIFIFNRGDGQDYIHDKGGNDTVKLNGIDISEIGLLSGNGTLGISYGTDGHISFNGSLELIELNHEYYLTEANINYIIQEISAFSRDKGISFSSAQDVQKNEYLNSMITAQWQKM